MSAVAVPPFLARAPRLAPSVPWVKVCGLTREADVDVAVSCGASAIGFVFWTRSPRAIDAATAARLRQRIPPGVLAVGVFVDESVDAINAMVARAGLDAVQLHGDEPPAVRTSVSVPCIKAIVGGRHDDAWIASIGNAGMLLADARDAALRGGTGRIADWDAAAAVARVHPLVLAGGLTADNVVRATRHVAPMAVDVSSGVESSPGVKDAGRLRELFAAVAAMEIEGR